MTSYDGIVRVHGVYPKIFHLNCFGAHPWNECCFECDVTLSMHLLTRKANQGSEEEFDIIEIKLNPIEGALEQDIHWASKDDQHSVHNPVGVLDCDDRVIIIVEENIDYVFPQKGNYGLSVSFWGSRSLNMHNAYCYHLSSIPSPRGARSPTHSHPLCVRETSDDGIDILLETFPKHPRKKMVKAIVGNDECYPN